MALGVVYVTSMGRPDAALALGAMYVFDNKRDARIGAVCVCGAGLDTAIYCDVVGRIYLPGNRNGNQALAVGLAVTTPAANDPPMIRAALERTKADGELQYARGIRRVSDTSLAEAVLRNGVTFNAESSMVLSAPATWLARSLDLGDAKEVYRQRVKRLVVVDGGAPQADVGALRKVLAEWPGPVFFMGREVGEALLFPATKVAEVFAWAPAHPVVDAYRAFRTMPYDAPTHDLAAMHFAAKPDAGLFAVSGPGSLDVSDGGRLTFTLGGGTVRQLSLDADKREEAIAALVASASAAPAAPVGRGRGGDLSQDE
jgi:hypothetical protein